MAPASSCCTARCSGPLTLAGRGAERCAPAATRPRRRPGHGCRRSRAASTAGLAAAMAAQIAAGARCAGAGGAQRGRARLVPALAARLDRPAAGVIFADAILPHPGRSWFDTAPAELRHQLRAGAAMGCCRPGTSGGRRAPWSGSCREAAVARRRCRRAGTAAARLFRGAARRTAPLAAPAAYLQLSGAYEDEARLAVRQGWPLVRLELDHLAPLTRPAPVALALSGLGQRVAIQGRLREP